MSQPVNFVAAANDSRSANATDQPSPRSNERDQASRAFQNATTTRNQRLASGTSYEAKCACPKTRGVNNQTDTDASAASRPQRRAMNKYITPHVKQNKITGPARWAPMGDTHGELSHQPTSPMTA